MLDLVLIVVFSIGLVPLVEYTDGAARIVFGLLFLLFSPGYSLIAALFPGKTSLGIVERLALSFGFSFATVALIGLLLNYTPLGIRTYPVLLGVLAFIVAMVAIAWYRRRRFGPEERYRVDPGLFSRIKASIWAGQQKVDKLLNIVLVVVILGTVVTLGYVVFNPKVGEKFTEFYILGAQGMADDYPEEIVLGESAWVTLGIINREQELTTYNVEVTIQDQTAFTAGPIALEHDEKHEMKATFTPTAAGENQRVEFNLYREGSQEVYLSLHLWLDVVQSAGG